MFFDLLLFDEKSVARGTFNPAFTERPLMHCTALHSSDFVFFPSNCSVHLHDRCHAIMFFDLLLFDEKSVVRAGLSVARAQNVRWCSALHNTDFVFFPSKRSSWYSTTEVILVCSLTHGLRTPRQSFFSKIRNFWAWAEKLGWNLMRHLGYFWPNYKHYFGTVSPLSMGKCSWFSFLQKTLVFRSKTFNSQILPK